jgi:alkylglycerol monooxygenase
MKFIVLAIPGFFILIAIELLIDLVKKTKLYRLNDAVTNINLGIGSQISGLFLKLFTVAAYAAIYEKLRFFTIQDTWYTFTLLFIGVDFFYYWFHRLAHELAVLWGSHVVHHQSEEYNLTVALRQSWSQGAFSWVFYLPLAFLGFNTGTFIMVGAIQTLYQFWIHTRLIRKLPAPFEYLFNTPSHHRVHHGVNPKYIDRNHGGTLIIWDRLFGTFQEEEEDVVYGITTPADSWNPLWLNLDYYFTLAKTFLHMPGIGNKLAMLWHAPGWKPKELGGTPAFKEVDAAQFHKYDKQIPRGLNWYSFVQFIIILGFTSFFLNVIEKEPYAQDLMLKLSLSIILIINICGLGAILDDKRWTPILEFIRLIMLGTGALLLLQHFIHGGLLFVGIAILLIISASLLWFSRFLRHYLKPNPLV